MFAICGPMGLAGWVVMAAVWAALVALVVWAIARLFPERPRPPAQRPGPGTAATPEDVRGWAEPPITTPHGAGRR